MLLTYWRKLLELGDIHPRASLCAREAPNPRRATEKLARVPIKAGRALALFLTWLVTTRNAGRIDIRRGPVSGQ
jgi:hypothetical protein